MIYALVTLYVAAVIAGNMLARTVVRWRRIRAREVVRSAAQLADLPMGSRVLFAGRTPAGPQRPTPLSNTPAVYYRLEHTTTRHIGSNNIETTIVPTKTWGNFAMEDGAGGRVYLDVDLGRESLFGRRPLLRHGASRTVGRDTPSESQTLGERYVNPDVPVLAAGMIGLIDGELGLTGADWVDGTTEARIEELPRRYVRSRNVRLVVLLVLLSAAVLLSVVHTS